MQLNIRNNISFLKNRGEKVDEYETNLTSFSTKLKDNIHTQLFGPKKASKVVLDSNGET